MHIYIYEQLAEDFNRKTFTSPQVLANEFINSNRDISSSSRGRAATFSSFLFFLFSMDVMEK